MGLDTPYVRGVVLAIAGGIISVVQTGINARLSKAFLNSDLEEHEYGSFFSACSNFLVGLIAITVMANIQKPGVAHMKCGGMRWYNYLAGPLGASYVTSAIVFSPKLGVALFFIVLMTGTLTMSLLIDKKGFLTLPKRPVIPRHFIALAILLGGALMVKEPHKMGNDDSGVSAGMKVLYSVIVFFVGFANPVQAGINRSTAGFVGGPFWATWMSFCGGFFATTIVAMIMTGIGGTAHLDGRVEWWNFLGGICGAIFVVSAVVATPVIGACNYYCIMVASQLTTAFLFDSIPLMDYKKKEISALRVIGTIVSIGAIVFYSLPVKAKPAAAEEVAEKNSQEGESLEADAAGRDAEVPSATSSGYQPPVVLFREPSDSAWSGGGGSGSANGVAGGPAPTPKRTPPFPEPTLLSIATNPAATATFTQPMSPPQRKASASLGGANPLLTAAAPLGSGKINAPAAGTTANSLLGGLEISGYRSSPLGASPQRLGREAIDGPR